MSARATAAVEPTEPRWLTPGVRGIGAASLLADFGHEVPTALLPSRSRARSARPRWPLV